jgi:AcrR family transcriptional regulator
VTTTTKQRILDVTADLFRRYGYTGTGLKQIVTEANAPFGSLFHHFPGGKQDLGAEVIRRSGRMYYELFEAIADAAPDPVTAVTDFFAGAAEVLRATDYADACPIATVALEVASTSEPLRRATAEVFERWLGALDTRLVGAGLTKTQARTLSVSLFSLLEGAFILARATRDHRHVRTAGRALADLVRAALEKRSAQVAARNRR